MNAGLRLVQAGLSFGVGDVVPEIRGIAQAVAFVWNTV
jgi:hypothetical protein